jgi:hypothetical protein
MVAGRIGSADLAQRAAALRLDDMDLRLLIAGWALRVVRIRWISTAIERRGLLPIELDAERPGEL